MAKMLCRTKGDASPQGKPRVFFTCHPADFAKYFDKVCEDIFKTQDCAVYYTQDMEEPIPQQDLATDLGSNNLVVVPVTVRLLTEPNRAMDGDIPYATEAHIPVLPLMMEPGLDEIYAREDKFGSLQYLNPCSHDLTEIAYGEKLKKYLNSVLIGDETAKRIRAAFDAYIFLSYRKKDRRYANSLMKMIHRDPRCRDIAIWYDEFLNPGESFSDNIRKVLTSSKLFALLVTPSLLEEPDGSPNFVMGVEYPAAKSSGIGILPVQMQETEYNALREKYRDIPDCVDPSNEAQFRERLRAALEMAAVRENDEEPEHNFLIGLAYLEGIDVEVDRRRGEELITRAAEAELPEAMEKLQIMYENGQGVALDLRKAYSWAEKLAAFYERTCGKDAPETMMTLSRLADIATKQGEFRQAAQLWNKVVGWAGKELGVHDPLVVELSANLPVVFRNLGDYQMAYSCAKWAYKNACAAFEKTDASFLQAQQNLVTSYCDIGRYRKALELQEDTCRRIREIYGREHPDTIAAQFALVSLYMRLGENEKAREIGETVMETAKDIWQESSLELLVCQSEMSVLYEKLGDYEKAQRINRQILELAEKTYGEKHPLTLYAMNNMAQYCKDSDIRKSLEITLQVYAGMCEIYGAEHPKTTETEQNLALLYFLLGQYEETKVHTENVYTLRESKLGAEHPQTLEALRNLAACYENARDRKKAIELGEKAWHVAERAFGEDDPQTLTLLHDLARYYRAFGLTQKACELFEKAYRKRCQVLGEDHPDTVASGRILVKVKKAQRGLPAERRQELLQQSKDLFWQLEACKQQGVLQKTLAANRALCTCCKELMGEAHPKVIQLMKEQVQLCEQLGLYEEAIQAGLAAVEDFSDAWGSTNPDVMALLMHLRRISKKL